MSTKPGIGKRKPEDFQAVNASSAKKSKFNASSGSNSKSKGKAKLTEQPEWPREFTELFKIFKALNTVVAFCSSRKQLATTFPVIRRSVEGLLKHPLELARVAEIKALLPYGIRFAYIPAADLRVNETSHNNSIRADSPDIYALPDSAADEEHVLVLDFIDNGNGKGTRPLPTNSAGYSNPPSLTPQALKKLIEKRNERFSLAVEELLSACIAKHEDPVHLIQTAAKEHIPVNPEVAGISSTSSFANTSSSKVPDSAHRPSIEDVIDELISHEAYKDQIVDRRVFEEKGAKWGSLTRVLSQAIVDALYASRNVTGFYEHQALAMNALWAGKHVIVSTSTASGKSVIYQVPLLCHLEDDRDATAIFIYPTKALAQDQRAALEGLLRQCTGLEEIKVATYDGDTPKEARNHIRETASVIFTNFDTIHASILPNEDNWRRFLKNMKLLVVDELHYYSGLMGSHVAMVMRRFRRVCAAVGNRRCRFVSCSATISNPKEHMANIFGVDDIEVITADGAPSGRKEFIVWNPPLIDDLEPLSGRVSSLAEACGLFRFLIKRGVRTILFCKIRRTCEMVMKVVRSELAAEGRGDVLARVMAYRGGYSQQDRRKIEAEAFSGNLLGLIATNALELGVDIGTLDAVITLGFPYSIASFRQQTGRAGRRARDSLAVLVPDSLPIDQHFANNPDEMFTRPVEDLLIDLDNSVVMEGHIQCAADEMPIKPEEDEVYFGPALKSLCHTLAQDKEGWYHTNPNFQPSPWKHVSIRGPIEDKYSVVDVTKGGNKTIEEIEISRALFETYEGAVFMHQGLTFIVNEVSHDDKVVRLMRSDVNWITRPRDFTDVDPIETLRIREIRGSPQRAFYGRIKVTTVVFGFFKLRNNVILDTVDLETPPFVRETTGFWVNVPKHVLNLLTDKYYLPAEGIHSAQHSVLNLAPLYAASANQDIKTECKAPSKEYKATDSTRKRPARLVFYDSSGKGSGVSAKAFDHVSELLHQALDNVETCDCELGCPKCIEGSNCREGNVVASKISAKVVLKGVLGLPIDVDSIPFNDGPRDPLETVVEASDIIQQSRNLRVEPATS